MEDDLHLASAVSLDSIAAGLAPAPLYLSPGGRRFLLAAAVLSGMHRGARVLDVGCGFGAGAIDLAAAFACRVVAFDSHEPYLSIARLAAAERNVASLVTFRQLAERESLAEFKHGAYDVVVGLGGALSDAIPGGLVAGVAAAAAWLSVGGVVMLSEMISAAAPSPLMEAIFGERLRSEETLFEILEEFGFEVIFASRATSGDWTALHRTLTRLQEKSIPLKPAENEPLDRIMIAAAVHPEIAYLNVVARRRPE